MEACTLPTAERPLRMAEFDELFASTLRSTQRVDDTHVRLLLAGDDELAQRVLRLAAAESTCCSFFTFKVTPSGNGLVRFDIEVPSEHADVLAGLLSRATSGRGQDP